MRFLSKKVLFIVFCFAVCSVFGLAEVTFSGSASAPEHKLSLWYRQPATNWMTSALPMATAASAPWYLAASSGASAIQRQKPVDGNKTNRGPIRFGDHILIFRCKAAPLP
jgi:alpha-L-fucosidase 2